VYKSPKPGGASTNTKEKIRVANPMPKKAVQTQLKITQKVQEEKNQTSNQTSTQHGNDKWTTPPKTGVQAPKTGKRKELVFACQSKLLWSINPTLNSSTTSRFMSFLIDNLGIKSYFLAVLNNFSFVMVHLHGVVLAVLY
jgi:hypothetical protein